MTIDAGILRTTYQNRQGGRRKVIVTLRPETLELGSWNERCITMEDAWEPDFAGHDFPSLGRDHTAGVDLSQGSFDLLFFSFLFFSFLSSFASPIIFHCVSPSRYAFACEG